MKEKDKKQIKTKIHAEIERLQSEITRLSELAEAAESAEAFDGLDEVERMDAVLAKSNNDSSLAAYRLRLARLELTEKRIDEDPDFGVCIECGDPIPVPRLLAMPDAGRCVNCAE